MEILKVPRIVVTLVILSSILKHTVVLDNIEGHPSTQIASELFPCNNTLAMKHCLTTTNRRSCHNLSSYLYIFALVLLNVNDCHPNPGPRAPKYPCHICSKACTWSTTVFSVACNNCELWHLKHCLNMNTQTYEALDISWYCCNCGLPNFNTCLFENFVELSIPINTTTDTDGSILDISTMGPPLTTSTPKNKPKQQARNKITKRSLRLLIINFQSISSKRRAFGTCLNKQSLPSLLPPKHGYTKEYLRGKSFQKTAGLLLEETD